MRSQQLGHARGALRETCVTLTGKQASWPLESGTRMSTQDALVVGELPESKLVDAIRAALKQVCHGRSLCLFYQARLGVGGCIRMDLQPNWLGWDTGCCNQIALPC